MSLGFLGGFFRVSLRSLHKTSAPPRPLNNALHLQHYKTSAPPPFLNIMLHLQHHKRSTPPPPCDPLCRSVAAPTASQHGSRVAASQRQQRRSVAPASQRRSVTAPTASQRRSRVAASQRQQRRSVDPASQRRSATRSPERRSVAASQRRSATRPQERHSATSETHVSGPSAPPL